MSFTSSRFLRRVNRDAELDIDRYIGSPGSRRSSTSREPPIFTGSRKNSSTREPRLYPRKNLGDNAITSPVKCLIKDPFGMKSETDDRYDRYDSPSSQRRNLLNSSYLRGKDDNDRNYPRSNDNSRGASLLKYEVRSYRDPTKTLKSSDYLREHTNDQSSMNGDRTQSNGDRSPRPERYVPTYSKKPASRTSESDTSEMPGVGCAYCSQYKVKLRTSEEKLESEMESTKILFRQKNKLAEQIIELNKKLEEEASKPSNNCEEELKELENIKQENIDYKNEIKNLKRDVKKKDKLLEEEETQVRKLKIKLEDTSFEKDRVRTELIASQLENEKVIEENEDLAVDNEDLIKERDEILQIYDELFRESERLKHEVEIWKTVFQASNPGGEVDIGEAQPEKTDDTECLFNPAWIIEEDPMLLLPPRDDLSIKRSDPSKIFDISREEIGRGKFGKLYKAIEHKTGHLYTAKYIKVTSKLHEDVMNCIEVMKKLHHVRLMNLFDVYDLDSQIVMIVEYVGGGTLFERIVKENSLTEADCKHYVKQILHGVYHMHSQNICHLELTPENIVCVNNDSMEFKLIDFGRAKQLVQGKETKITAGSPEFVAPEILSFDPVSLASDMWSIGVITYVLLSGISPFIGDDDQDTLMNVSSGEYEYEEKAFINISDDAKDFIDGLLIAAPTRARRNVTSCLDHSWMKLDAEARYRNIDLHNLKEFLKKRKEKPMVSAGRAIRRFSSFAVGPKKVPMRSNSPSTFLSVPTLIQNQSIVEEDEEEENQAGDSDSSFNGGNNCGPMIQVTQDSGRSSPAPERTPFDETESKDGLRDYLQRMIDAGHLPGSRGSIDIDMSNSESGNEEE